MQFEELSTPLGIPFRKETEAGMKNLFKKVEKEQLFLNGMAGTYVAPNVLAGMRSICKESLVQVKLKTFAW